MKEYSGREKDIRWIGSSYDDLLGFPQDARKEIGFQLGKVQFGIEPDDWKSYDIIGSGVREIRVRCNPGTYRVLYVAKFEEAIYVLHCFTKKSKKTAQSDKMIAMTRYRALLQERSQT